MKANIIYIKKFKKKSVRKIRKIAKSRENFVKCLLSAENQAK